jgi:ADP-heptose:LPS heptosyltransferase
MFLNRGVSAGAFECRHIVKAMADIATLAGGIQDDWGTEVFWDETITTKWEELLAETTGEIVIGINPGGDREDRRWRPERFAVVAAKLIESYKARIVLLGGPTEREIAADIAGRIKYDVSDLSGKIKIEELPYVISRLDLLITNDSGPMHIAAATKTPLVALFGPEDPTLFGPYTKPELCRVIYKGGRSLAGLKNNATASSLLDMITIEEVLAASGELLALRK